MYYSDKNHREKTTFNMALNIPQQYFPVRSIKNIIPPTHHLTEPNPIKRSGCFRIIETSSDIFFFWREIFASLLPVPPNT